MSMKKQIIISLIFLNSVLVMNAQTWSGSTPGDIYYNQGNIGIGTAAPYGKIHARDGIIVIDNSTSVFGLSKYNSQGVSWATDPSVPSLVFNGKAADRPEIAWIRGSRTYPEFAIRQHFATDKGGTIYSGTGLVAPTATMSFYNGSVGIGTESPLDKLFIMKAITKSGNYWYPGITVEDTTVQAEGVGGGIAFRGSYRDDGVAATGGLIDIAKYNSTSGNYSFDMRFFTRSSGQAIAEGMRIDYRGYVGIGTTTPYTKAHIYNGSSGAASSTSNTQLTIENSSTTGLQFLSPNTTSQFLLFGDPENTGIGYIKYDHSTNSMTFKTNAAQRLTIDGSGNVGIGTTTPNYLLQIDGITADTNVTVLKLNHRASTIKSGTVIELGHNSTTTAHTKLIGYSNPHSNLNSQFEIQTYNGTWNTGFYQNERGNVLIGKTTQINSDYKLDVEGKIRANEVIVNTTGADFVFAPEYKLPTLSEVESFIKENNHLPDIAPASEMKKNGMNMSEMQTKLLQKMEELTLYIIEQNKNNESQSNEIELLKKEISMLKEHR